MDRQCHALRPEARKSQPIEFVDLAEQTLHEKISSLLWYYQR